MSGCRGPIERDDDVPRIHVRCVGETEPEWLEHVEYGMEEEDVSWVVQSGFDGDDVAVAYEAIESSLEIGLSVSEDSRVVIHHKQLPDGDPMFDVQDISPSLARTLGTNSARLAKGTPLKSVG